LCHRILYELLQKENIINKVNKEILSNNNFDLIMNIFDSLCKEYYFNIKQNLPIHNLQSLLKNFLKSLGKLYIFGQKWVQNLIKHIFDIMNSSNKEETNVKEDKSEKMTASLVRLKLKEALELNNIYFEDKNEIQIIKNIEKKPKEKEIELILEKCKKCD
jgi:predicted MPP superfamily phosphohydrolase